MQAAAVIESGFADLSYRVRYHHIHIVSGIHDEEPVGKYEPAAVFSSKVL